MNEVYSVTQTMLNAMAARYEAAERRRLILDPGVEVTHA